MAKMPAKCISLLEVTSLNITVRLYKILFWVLADIGSDLSPAWKSIFSDSIEMKHRRVDIEAINH